MCILAPINCSHTPPCSLALPDDQDATGFEDQDAPSTDLPDSLVKTKAMLLKLLSTLEVRLVAQTVLS